MHVTNLAIVIIIIHMYSQFYIECTQDQIIRPPNNYPGQPLTIYNHLLGIAIYAYNITEQAMSSRTSFGQVGPILVTKSGPARPI